MTARLAVHPQVQDRAADVLHRLLASGVDVEPGPDLAVATRDPLHAVEEGTADLALVGLAQLRGNSGGELTTVAVLPRSEYRDVVVASEMAGMSLSELPEGARVALSGARRAAFLGAHRPDLVAVRCTREEMRARATDPDGGRDVAAFVMSALDARHFGWADRTVEALDPKAWLPEPGQGALALVARHPIAEATALDHLPTRTALRTELALLDALASTGDAPVGCLAQPSGRWIRLWAAAASPDGRRLVRSDLTGPLDEAEALGHAVAGQLMDRGYRLTVETVG